MTRYVILRDDGLSDAIAGQVFNSYDEAYTVLERYAADFCCSDERESYRIEAECWCDPLSLSSSYESWLVWSGR